MSKRKSEVNSIVASPIVRLYDSLQFAHNTGSYMGQIVPIYRDQSRLTGTERSTDYKSAPARAYIASHTFYPDFCQKYKGLYRFARIIMINPIHLIERARIANPRQLGFFQFSINDLSKSKAKICTWLKFVFRSATINFFEGCRDVGFNRPIF
jgi:hypothetical protein